MQGQDLIRARSKGNLGHAHKGATHAFPHKVIEWVVQARSAITV